MRKVRGCLVDIVLLLGIVVNRHLLVSGSDAGRIKALSAEVHSLSLKVNKSSDKNSDIYGRYFPMPVRRQPM